MGDLPTSSGTHMTSFTDLPSPQQRPPSVVSNHAEDTPKTSNMDVGSNDIEVGMSPASDSQLFVAPRSPSFSEVARVNTISPFSEHGHFNVDQHDHHDPQISHEHEHYPPQHDVVLASGNILTSTYEGYPIGLAISAPHNSQELLDSDFVDLFRNSQLHMAYSTPPVKTEPEIGYHPPSAYEHDPPPTPAISQEYTDYMSPLQLAPPQFPVYHGYSPDEMMYTPPPSYAHGSWYACSEPYSTPQTPNGHGGLDDNELSPEIQPSEPYAKLIYRCLLDAPNHTLVLNDIYNWFRINSSKIKDPADMKETGWKNSIRHNLSMNKVSATSPSNQ